MNLEKNKIYQGDCLEIMKKIDDKSIDMILCDLPYGMTACKWDTEIPLDLLWEQYKRIIKNNSAIVLTASQPFTSKLVMSNLEWFKCEWIYKKLIGTNFAQAKYMPFKEHENILVFSNGKTKYYPIMEERKGSGQERIKYKYTLASCDKTGEVYNFPSHNTQKTDNYFVKEKRYPSSVQEFNNRKKCDVGLHPTQKPIELFKYLIKTYSQENDIILDSCIGSGTTAIACLELNRNFIGIEYEKKYFEIANERIKSYKSKNNKFFYYGVK